VFLQDRVTLYAEPHHGLEQSRSFPNPLGFHIILARLFDKSRGLLFSLDGVPTGIRLLDLEIGRLLGGKSDLGDPLAGSSKLHRQLPVQLRLLSKMVPNVPLTTEEQGLVTATLHEGL
jgi:hypothetical protein